MFQQDSLNSFSALNATLDKLNQAVVRNEYMAETSRELSSKVRTQSIERELIANSIQQDSALSIFVQKMITLGFLDRSYSPVYPPGYYIINDSLKAVYCAIPKNACTLFKTMMVEHSSSANAFTDSEQNVHQFLDGLARKVRANHLLNCLTSDEYFKFTVLRDPLNRIVSGYLDKFAKHPLPEPFVQDIILEIRSALGQDADVEKSVTFSEFVDYLVRTPDEQLNDHWRPQHNFTAAVPFNFIGQFESIDSVVHTLEDKLSINIRTEVSNHRTQYRAFDADSSFHTMYPDQLRAIGKMPAAQNFLVPSIREKLRSRYRRDIELYTQAFS